MAADGRFKGQDGKNGTDGTNGTNGKDGQNGKDGVVDYDKVRDEVIAKMPAFSVQFVDNAGKVVEEVPFVYDPARNVMVMKFNPLTVETYDAAGKYLGTDTFPIPWGIKLKPLVITKLKGA